MRLERDEDVPAFVESLAIPGLFDVHVHFLPPRLQRAVWDHFDRLTPDWPVHYRHDEATRLATLRRLGVRRHTALAYAHKPGMLAWLNRHTLDLAARHPEQVVPTFTLYPEPGVTEAVAAALDAGGACVKVHLQVGKFHVGDPLLDEAWSLLERAATPIVLHAGAVADGSGGEEWCGAAPVRRLLERFPGLRLVIAHLGAPEYDAFLAFAEDHPLVCLDTAMALTDPEYLGESPDVRDRLAALGDRVLFGSDFPTIPHAFVAQVRGLVRLGLGDEWLRRVFWENAAQIFRR